MTPYLPKPRQPISPDQLDYLSSLELRLLVEGSDQLWVTHAKSRHFQGSAVFWQEVKTAALELLARRGDRTKLTDEERDAFDDIARRIKGE